jgi:hypothetical protein
MAEIKLTEEQRATAKAYMDRILWLLDDVEWFRLVDAPMKDVELWTANDMFRQHFESASEAARLEICRTAPTIVAMAIHGGALPAAEPGLTLDGNCAGLIGSFLKAKMGAFFNGAPHIAKGHMTVKFKSIDLPFTQQKPGTTVGAAGDVEVVVRLPGVGLMTPPARTPCPFCLQSIEVALALGNLSAQQEGAPMICAQCGEVSVVTERGFYRPPEPADLERWQRTPGLARQIADHQKRFKAERVKGD